MKKLVFTLILVLGMAAAAYAIPVLQVGVENGSGWYLPYTASSSNPIETDTAITNGSSFVVGGLVAPTTTPGGKTITEYLGGKIGAGYDWSNYGLPAETFNGHGALLLVSVPDGTGSAASGSLRINGDAAFAWDAVNNYFPNNHDPVKEDVADFLFFDIGSFSSNPNTVPDFSIQPPPASPEKKAGEIKSFTIAGGGDLAWLHFDVMAIQTLVTVNGTTEYSNRLENNPGSHDVTEPPAPPVTTVPEPGTLVLIGAGLFGLGIFSRRRMSK